MRPVLFLVLLMTCSCRAQGPYSALLITGDTLKAKEYYMRGDTVGFPGVAKVARKDIVLFWTRKERWTFTYPKGGQERIKLEMTDSCAYARVAKVRHGYRLLPFDSLSIPPAWRTDTLVRSCYEDWLLRRWTAIEEEEALEEERTRYMVPEGNGGVGIGRPNEIILRTGDTLVVQHDLYGKDGLLCAYGGDCVPERDVLLVRTVKGQFYFHPAHKYKVRLKGPIPDMSPGSQGRLRANLLFATGLEWDSVDVPQALRTDTVFLASYRKEVVRLTENMERARNRANAGRIMNGGMAGGPAGTLAGMIVGAAVGGAMSTPRDERPYYGTPMPPE